MAFFALTFAITWTLQLGLVLTHTPPGSVPGLAALLVAGFGPTIAALVTGRPGPWRAPPRWGLIALVVPSAIRLAAGGGLGAPAWDAALLPPLGEEPGWRGVGQPWLEARTGRRLGPWILGVVWGMWHLPTVFLYGGVLAEFPLFLAQIACVSVCVSWIYRRAGVPGAILAHAGVNLGVVTGGSSTLVFAMWAALAAAITAATGSRPRARAE